MDGDIGHFEHPETGAAEADVAIDDAGVVTVIVATLRNGSQEKRFTTWVLDRAGAVVSRTPASGWLLSATATRVVCATEGEMGLEVRMSLAQGSTVRCGNMGVERAPNGPPGATDELRRTLRRQD